MIDYMPCSNPTQGYLRSCLKKSGEPGRVFVPVPPLGKKFRLGQAVPDDVVSVSCGQCMFCRLERSRETALRCTHEARMFQDNCFITLTYDDESLKMYCPLTEGGYSLVRKHAQDFMKRLRDRFFRGFSFVLRDGKERFYCSDLVRAYGCGEYGDKNGRPHYHFCLFNCCFPDRVYEGGRNGFRYYSSDVLKGLWPFGFSSVCDFSFETAAYVARYCTKKITGTKAVEHYRGRLPEFAVFPTRGGGLGKPWFDKYGKTDVFPTDSCIARYIKCGVPKYYDVLRARIDPEGLAAAKQQRSERAKLRADDNTYARLLDKEKCMNAKIKCLTRVLEK